ncbi:agamous-like MADS-box protein AGL14 [Rhodamnia argentea]|uniref:Agamous-like MADS-box protein AGL14 n=1 Tax=Rhodamnia argentea TaxID=178133 RepID=A0A8B8QU52_9MYRT|nr:agamous-like MADS-box protein AGL14 [Rhodamnia argentea]
MGKRRRTEIAKIADPSVRLVTYSKRRKGLFKKASEFCHLCGARAAIIVFFPAGKPCSLGDPSAEEVISEYIGGYGDVVPPMGLAELEDWIEKELNSCTAEEVTAEDLESLIVKNESVRELALKSLEDVEKKSSIMIGAGGDTGAGLGCNSENLSDQEINLVFESFKAGCPALFEDCLCDGDGDAFLTPPEKSVAGSGSWAVDSIRTSYHLEESGFNPDNFLDLSGDCVGFGDGDKFLTLPGNSATGVGSLGEESMFCDLEGCGFNPDDFLSLFDLEDCIGDGDRDSFLTLLENSAIGSGGSGEDSAPCDLEGYLYDPDHFLTLEDLDVPL